MKDTEKRVRDAVAAFVTRKGWELLSIDHEGFVVYDDGELVFAGVAYSIDPTGEFPEYTPDRKAFERAMVSWLVSNPDSEDKAIRLDAYEVKVVLKDKAILRHHISINCNAEVEHAEA